MLEEAKQSLEQGDLERSEYDLRIETMDSEYPQGFKPFGRDALRFALLSQNIQGMHIISTFYYFIMYIFNYPCFP